MVDETHGTNIAATLIADNPYVEDLCFLVVKLQRAASMGGRRVFNAPWVRELFADCIRGLLPPDFDADAWFAAVAERHVAGVEIIPWPRYIINLERLCASKSDQDIHQNTLPYSYGVITNIFANCIKLEIAVSKALAQPDMDDSYGHMCACDVDGCHVRASKDEGI